MAVRGDITIECDGAFCHAEIVIDAENLWPSRTLAGVVTDNEWERRGEAVICSHCIQERRTADAAGQ